jgi:hypothetical protein
MKVYYMNDEQKDITVRIIDLTFSHTGGDNSHLYIRLQSCESRVFDLQVPEGAVLYVKKWKDAVLLSYIEAAGLAQLEPRQQHGAKA